MAEVNKMGKYLGLHVIVKGVLADPTAAGLTALSLTDSAGVHSYTHFYIKLDSAAAGAATGALKIKNAHGTELTLNFNNSDEWYPEMIQEIVQDAGNAVRGIVYGVAY